MMLYLSYSFNEFDMIIDLQDICLEHGFVCRSETYSGCVRHVM